MERLRDEVAFITGGAQGIGLGIARALAGEGAKLALADVDRAALDVASKALADVTSVMAFELDVRDRDAYAKVADAAETGLGPVTLVFNNAGVATAIAPEMMTYEQWDWVLGINLNGVVNGIQTFLPRMIERGARGHIVNTASGAGLAVGGSGFLYATSKFAVVGLSESLRDELEPQGIGISVLCPGPVATNILANTRTRQPQVANSPTNTERTEALRAGEALLRAGKTPDEVGEMVLRAIKANDLYIHTDSIMADAVRARTDAILAAMPS